MLNRELPLERDSIDNQTEKKLDNTLASFFPRGWHALPSPTRKPTPTAAMPNTIGEHLIFCNPIVADDKLLPDGTDQLHSPGGSFVRRMWAGGAVRVNKSLYFDANAGWASNKHILCSERIKDVRLRGYGEKEKIFLTIERKFARYDPIFQAIQDSRHKPRRGPSLAVSLKEKMRDWNEAFLTEDRNIVFMHERSPEELEDIKAGRMAPVKYLQCR
jgi:hydroxyacyl-ACP dehydratase HTD2-like protein with hotdog domain